jgi:TRAP-type transport system periplasmic protein
VAWGDAPQFVFKLHHALSSVSSGHDKFLVPWARKVHAESGGHIRIDIFPSMQLGGQPAQLFDQARDGLAEIAWAAPNLTPGRFPKIEMFELPFVPSRRALVSSKALEDFAAANLKDEFGEVHPICFSCVDRGVVHATRPVRTVEDIKGLRLHVETRFAGEAVNALGAHAIFMPSAQLPLAITQHVVDGCVLPWDLVPRLKLNDLLKTHTEFAEQSPSSTTLVLAMNKAAYDRLPAELKKVIDRNAGQFAASMAGSMWDVQAAAVTDMVSQRGDPIVTLLPEAVAHWRKTTDPVVEAWVKDMKEHKVDGGKLLANARALLAKYADIAEPQPPQAVEPPEQNAVTQPAQPPQSPQPASVTAAPKANVAAPAPTPPAPVARAAAPTPAAPVAKPAVAAVPAPVAPMAPAAPPIPKPVPAVLSPPKTLDIPL